MDDLKYPVGNGYTFGNIVDEKDYPAYIQTIADAPLNLRAAVKGLSDKQLDTPYRPDGWTVRQVVHHLADSHMNAYIRLKLALTEEMPTIKPYEEAEWAKLPDSEMP
ncbi:MAG: maleylpyruvate isomerase N-terminal domain-containing protein, partial [Gemmatimonadaceae bacterium]|nr:maleylpyruvate isomerase N-terminal domain-containing protein [Gemmatimonadaceae bacterium]